MMLWKQRTVFVSGLIFIKKKSEKLVPSAKRSGENSDNSLFLNKGKCILPNVSEMIL